MNTVTDVDNPADLIRDARTALGLSTRELSRLTGVSYTVISRIENGHADPRWGTLLRLASALGHDLEAPRNTTTTPTLAGLVEPHVAAPHPQIDWTALRAFTDHLALHPETTAAAVHERPLPSGSLLLDNLLAGIAEKAAHDVDIRHPMWTDHVAPLREAWVAPGTPTMQQRAREFTPAELAHRNVFVAASAIWRDREPALA